MNCIFFFITLYRERPCTYLILHQSKRKVVECVFTEILFCWESFVMDVDFLHQLNFALPRNKKKKKKNPKDLQFETDRQHSAELIFLLFNFLFGDFFKLSWK